MTRKRKNNDRDLGRGWKPISLSRVAVVLGSGSVLAAIAIGVFSFNSAVKQAESQYQNFYMSKARMLAATVRASGELSDEQLLERIRVVWMNAGEKPVDEYICIVDRQAHLILHTAYPETRGNSAAANRLVGNLAKPSCSLLDLAESGDDYFGHYISSAGQIQLAAFRYIPSRQWTLGVHRSIKVLRAEVRSSMRHLAIGFGVVCGLLLPLSFLLVFLGNTFLFRKLEQAKTAQGVSEMRFQNMEESMADWIWEVDAHGVYSYCSEKSMTLLGYTPQELMGKTPFDLMTPEQAVASKEFFAGLLKENRPFRGYENWNLRKDGTLVYLSTSGVPVFSHDGSFVGYRGTDTDITERKQANDALRTSQQLLEGILNTISVRVFWKDKDLNVMGCNQAFAQDAGYDDPRDVVGKDDFQMGWRDQAELYRADDRLVIESGQPKLLIEEPQTTPDGKRIILLTSKIPLRDANGEICGVLGTYLDITARKQAEAERERLLTAIDQVSETVVITNIDGIIEYVNPAFERVSGYTRENAIGQNPRMLKSGKHTAEFYGTLWKTLLRGETWSGTLVNQKKDGTLYTEEASISPVKDAAGKIVNYVAVKRDVTDEIKLEDQIRQSQKMQAIGQLVGGVAHDFNNLLQVINGCAEIARMQLADNRSPAGSIDEIAKAGEHAKTLVQQLLVFSRRQVIDPIDLDLNMEIESAKKMLRRLIGEHIHFKFTAGKGVGSVFVDRGQIQQVLMNLCVNARDAMPDGGTLTIATEDISFASEHTKILLWAQPGRYVLIRVEDSGVGMEKELCDNIFDPFFTTKDLGKGTGLGLSTVYGIVKQNAGHIDVYSEPGNGTVFNIYLPVSQRFPAKGISPVSENIAPAERGVETILVAEDDETILKLATQIMRGGGYTVLTAKDGEEAVRVFEEYADEIDLVIMDVVMPRMGGKQAMDAILEKRPAMRYLFVSGYSPDAGHNDFIKDKPLHLLSKPYKAEALLHKVREVLVV